MTRHVRLALPEEIRQLSDRELLVRGQREEAEPNGLGEEPIGRLPPPALRQRLELWQGAKGFVTSSTREYIFLNTNERNYE